MADGVQLAGVGVQLVPNPAETGTVSSLTADTGITLTPSTITATGTVGLTVPVTAGLGGTGTTNLTSFGLLIGQGTSPVAITGPLSAGQLLIGQTSTSNPVATSLLGDLSLSAGGTTTVNKIQGTTVSGTTGTSAAVLSNSPTLVTPILGNATGTSIALTGAMSCAPLSATGVMTCSNAAISFTNLPGSDPGIAGRLYKAAGAILVSGG